MFKILADIEISRSQQVLTNQYFARLDPEKISREHSLFLGLGLYRQTHNLPAYFATLHSQPPHSDLQPEASRPRAPGIEVKHAIARLVLGHMAVPIDDGRESSSLRFQIERSQIVQNVDRNPTDFHHFGLGQTPRPGRLVDVPANRRERCDRRQLLENLRRAHIASMNDAVAPAQRLNRLRPKQSMRVGDNADDDALPQFLIPLMSRFISA